jgi:hypothetical protein
MRAFDRRAGIASGRAARAAACVTPDTAKAAHGVAAEATIQSAIHATVQAASQTAAGPASEQSSLGHGSQPQNRCHRHCGAKMSRFHVLCSNNGRRK